MKIRYVILGILVLYTAFFGWRYYYDLYTNSVEYRNLKAGIATENNTNETLKSDIASASDAYCQKYCAPKSNNLYDFVQAFCSDNAVTVTKIIGKKFTGDTYTIVASVNSVDEIHSLNDLDVLELLITTENIETVLTNMQNSNYAVDKLIVYPTDNCIAIDFIVVEEVTQDD